MTFETMGGSAALKTGMLLHAMAADGSQFREIGALLKDEYFLIIPTFDGHHREAKTVFGTLDEQVDKILHELQARGITELDFIAGTSLGALVAFEIYKRKTLKVRKYVFDGGPFFLMSKIQRTLRRWQFWLPLSLLKRFPGLARLSERKFGVDMTTIFIRNMQFLTNQDIYNIIGSIGSATLPESLHDGSSRLVFLYGNREEAYRSFKRFRGLPGVELIVKDGYAHCQYVMQQSAEYAEMLSS
jgi:pimeloyl-ACP methyl ester carboxylesterase